MEHSSARQTLFCQSCLAHIVGLLAISLYGSRDVADITSSILAAFLIGGLLSLPWLIVLGLLIWKAGAWLSEHIIAFCSVGPAVVCGSWLLLFGTPMLDAVGLSCTVSSATVLAMRFVPRWWAQPSAQ
ncbi:hypothetical protein LH128_06602 [Sphingomonas sp. LH128]|nr:hypothetical protein LH128_06602 [Sphingomonas sp. LH128]